MERKLLAILLLIALLVSLGFSTRLPVQASYGSDTIVLVSAGDTDTACRSPDNPSGDPLNEGHYQGSWWDALVITSPNTAWTATLTGAVWVSDEDPSEPTPSDEDSWRLFRYLFDVPCNVIIDSGRPRLMNPPT